MAIDAAIDRRTASGALLGPHESVDPAQALAMFLGRSDDPGGPPRQVEPGALADLCLLDRSLVAALSAPSSDHVRATWIAGEAVGAVR